MKSDELLNEYNRIADVWQKVSDASRAIAGSTDPWAKKLELAIYSIGPLRVSRFPSELAADFEVIQEAMSSLKRTSQGGFIIDTPQRCKEVALMILQLQDRLAWHAIFALGDAVSEIREHNGA